MSLEDRLSRLESKFDELNKKADSLISQVTVLQASFDSSKPYFANKEDIRNLEVMQLKLRDNLINRGIGAVLFLATFIGAVFTYGHFVERDFIERFESETSKLNQMDDEIHDYSSKLSIASTSMAGTIEAQKVQDDSLIKQVSISLSAIHNTSLPRQQERRFRVRVPRHEETPLPDEQQ